MRILVLAALTCALALAACATTTYKPFESRSDGIVNGKGGVQTLQSGMMQRHQQERRALEQPKG